MTETLITNQTTENTSTNENDLVPETVIGTGPGRPPLINEETFAAVWQAADSLDEVVDAFFPELTTDKEKKARRLYCSMRASTLRRDGGFQLKTFPRGRKPSKKVDVVQVVENVENAIAEDGAETTLKVAE